MKHSKLILTAILAFVLGIAPAYAGGLPMTPMMERAATMQNDAIPLTDATTDYTPVLVAFSMPHPGDKRYRQGWILLHYTAYENKHPYLDTALRHTRQYHVDTRTKKKKETALHIAASEGHETIVKTLLDFRADVNAKNIYGKTPLHKAAANGNRKVVEMLIKAGAQVDAKDRDGKTPMHQAAQAGKTRAVKLLAKNGANINAKDKEGMTPARLALEHGKHHPAAALINDLKADKSFLITSTLHDWTLLHHAAGHNNVKLAKAVIALGKTGVDDKDYFNRTALHHAAWAGSHEVAQILVDNGADIHAKDETNDSPIATAIRQFGRMSEIAIVLRRKQHLDWLRECNKKWKGNQFMLFFNCIEFNPLLSG